MSFKYWSAFILRSESISSFREKQSLKCLRAFVYYFYRDFYLNTVITCTYNGYENIFKLEKWQIWCEEFLFLVNELLEIFSDKNVSEQIYAPTESKQNSTKYRAVVEFKAASHPMSPHSPLQTELS